MSQYRDIEDKFLGKRPNPAIPTPRHQAHAVTESLVIPEKKLNPPVIERKPHIPHLKPHYNVLYGSIKTEGGWRYTVDNYATGTISPISGQQVSSAVQLVQTPNWRLEQWPGAVDLFLVIRHFSIAPRQQFFQQENEVNVPATAGNLTVFTGAGVLVSAVVTAVGTTDLEFQDGAGNVIAEVPSTATLDQVFQFNAAFGTSLVAVKATTTPVVTLTYSIQTDFFGDLGILYQDLIGGQVIPLGNVASNTGGFSSDSAILIPSPITDPGITSVGNLLVTLFSGATGGAFDWQMSFSGAYLIPALRPYDQEFNNADFVTHPAR